MKHTKPIPKRRRKPRRGPMRDRGYLDFLKEYGFCVACWRSRIIRLYSWNQCDPAHGPTNGLSSKGPDNEAIPLCRTHHDYQHEIGWKRFEEYFRFDRKAKAAEWWQAYQTWKQKGKAA